MGASIHLNKATQPLGARCFVVGRDSSGHWTVRGGEGLVGGIFKNKDAAMHYARSEAGGLPGAVRLTLAPQELVFDHRPLGKGEGLPPWWRLGRASGGAVIILEISADHRRPRPALARCRCRACRHIGAVFHRGADAVLT
jgi:hypothetical protein